MVNKVLTDSLNKYEQFNISIQQRPTPKLFIFIIGSYTKTLNYLN